MATPSNPTDHREPADGFDFTGNFGDGRYRIFRKTKPQHYVGRITDTPEEAINETYRYKKACEDMIGRPLPPDSKPPIQMALPTPPPLQESREDFRPPTPLTPGAVRHLTGTLLTDMARYTALLTTFEIPYDILSQEKTFEKLRVQHTALSEAALSVVVWGPKPKVLYWGDASFYMYFNKDGKFLACMPSNDKD